MDFSHWTSCVVFTQIFLHLCNWLSPKLIVYVDSLWWLVRWGYEQPAPVESVPVIGRGVDTFYLYHSMIYIALQSVLIKIQLGKLCKCQWQPEICEQAAYAVFAVENSLYRSETKGCSAREGCLCSMWSFLTFSCSLQELGVCYFPLCAPAAVQAQKLYSQLQRKKTYQNYGVAIK